MNKKKQYKTVFISDIHLWNPKNQWDKLIKFLNSISFENLIIIWDFIDYRQLNRFWRRREKDQKTLDYINNLAKNWIKVTYIQWNHDRELKCWKGIKIENMTICRDMYYKTLEWKKYYVTHWDCLDWVNKDWNKLWQIWSIVTWLLLKIEYLWNRNVYNTSYFSLAEKLEEWVKKVRMPESKINRLIKNFSKNIDTDWIIIWHFHVSKHYKINWLDYFNTWDWLKHLAAVAEDLNWNLELILYEW
jgi:UDP-2,3-diacylglucosamine pyrophosphatase LpxH